MSELVKERDLRSLGEIRVGSNPTLRSTFLYFLFSLDYKASSITIPKLGKCRKGLTKLDAKGSCMGFILTRWTIQEKIVCILCRHALIRRKSRILECHKSKFLWKRTLFQQKRCKLSSGITYTHIKMNIECLCAGKCCSQSLTR